MPARRMRRCDARKWCSSEWSRSIAGSTSASGSLPSSATRYFSASTSRASAPNVQLARYDSSDNGFYDWHTDNAGFRPLRKLSFSVQLSASEDYDGGDLELWAANRPQADGPRARRVDRVSELHFASSSARNSRHTLELGGLDSLQAVALNAPLSVRRYRFL